MEKCLDLATADPNVCPALMPPEGVMPFEPNAYTLLPYMIATDVVCLATAIPAVAVRIFTKAYILKKMDIEDYCLLLATAGFCAFIGVMNVPMHYNAGKHQWNVTIADTLKAMEWVNIVQILYSPPMFAAKLALLLQIQRIFTVKQKNFTYWSAWGLIVANALTYTGVFFAFTFACWPREAIWNPAVPGKCTNRNATMIATSAINLISDVTLLVLPIVGIASLQMPLKKKLAVSAIFATGVLACVACICRLVWTFKLARTQDHTYWVTPAGMWAAAEFATVLLCACLPTFPRFVKFLRGKDKQSTKNSYGSTPNVRPSPGHTKASLNHPKGLYAWDDTMQDERLGPYIHMDEHTSGYCTSEQPREGSQDSLRQEHRHDPTAIWVTTEFETSSAQRSGPLSRLSV